MLEKYKIIKKMDEREYLVRQASTIGFKFPEFFDPEKHAIPKKDKKNENKEV